MHALYRLIGLLMPLSVTLSSAAQSFIDHQSGVELPIVEAHERLDLAEDEILMAEERRNTIHIGALTRRVVSDIRATGEDCASWWQQRLQSVEETQTALGPVIDHDLPLLAGERAALQRRMQTTSARYAECRWLAVRAKQLLARLDQLKRDQATKQLFTRSTPLWIVVAGYFDAATGARLGIPPLATWPRAVIALMSLPALIAGGIIVPVGLAALFWRRRLLAATPPTDPSPTAYLRISLARRLPHIALSLSVALALALGQYGGPAMVLLLPALYWLIAPTVCALLCRPQSGPETSANAEARCRIAKTLRLAVATTLLWTATVVAGIATSHGPETALIRALSAVLLGMLLAHLIYTACSLRVLASLAILRWPGVLLAATGPVAEIGGYRHLADYLLTVTGGGFSVLVAGIVAGAGIRRGMAWLPHTGHRHAHRYRAAPHRADNDTARALVWIGLTLNAIVMLIVLYVLARIVDPTNTGVAALTDTLVHGFTIGELHIAPFRLLAALLGLVGLFVLARWLRIKLTDNWLPVTQLDRGARETVTNLSVYVVFAVGVLISLTIAGLDLSQLTIIAGALSVGIGFGLQNIVNNFVSGLILMFERPIRPGDWIEVGGTAGYVTKISIRYTLVQTFDRSDVIVPNSQLLSTQVVNWMLQDHYGRVIVPVGVAYGSDTEQVKAILLRLSGEHPLVVTGNPRIPPPLVYFMGFGDSCLEFELRAFIRDVDRKLSVRSDLLFSIDAEFRRAGIDIPFPQRELHIRTLPGNDDAAHSAVNPPRRSHQADLNPPPNTPQESHPTR